MIKDVEKEVMNIPQKLREPIDKAIKLFKKDVESENEEVMKLIEIFTYKPRYRECYIPDTDRRKQWLDNRLILRWVKNGLLNAKKLLEDG